MFSSTEIHLYKLFIQREQGFQFLTKLGMMNNMNLINISNTQISENDYYKQLKRCEDIYNKIGEINTILHLHNKEIHYCPNYEQFINNIDLNEELLLKIEFELQHKVPYIINQQTNLQQLMEKRNQIEEEIAVIQNCQEFINKFSGIQLGCLIGSISLKDQNKFNRIVFRITKENGIVNFYNLQNERVQFTLVFQQGKHDNLKQKLIKLCDAFSAIIYTIPNENEIETKILQLKKDLQNTDEIISHTNQEINELLDYFIDIKVEKLLDLDEIYNFGYCSYICEIKILLDLISATFYHLTFFEAKSSILIGQMWCQPKDLEIIKQMGFILEIQQDINEDLYEPPSLIKTNEFTIIFQELVNTYGLPRYKEINPGLYTIITFPFLFGMMFGDIGHGILLTIFGFYLLVFGHSILKNIKLQNHSQLLTYQDFQSLYSCRYLISLMGLFATYCGFIYNDFFSISLNYNTQQFKLGFDGKWSMTKQHLTLMNSFKMKTAIIVGVTHMVFGILLKGWNCIIRKEIITFLFSFIPELAFMLSTFGYMSFLIIMKWLTNFPNEQDAPSVITTLLNMVFLLGGVQGKEMYPHQIYVQTILIKIAIISPIIMLLKPYMILLSHKNSQQRNHQVYNELIENNQIQQKQEEQQHHHLFGQLKENKQLYEEKHFDFSEILIESLIECIEFVLGAVSNTASYLRLWALSLAHSQLSEVFFKMALEPFLKTGSIVGICLSFLIYAMATFGVLMCMDTLECFLHSLRLHWVEFQSKFYKGDGHQFQQFNYKYFLESKLQFNSRM